MLAVKVLSALAAMAMGAALVLLFPGVSPEADASTPPKLVKGDRLDARPIGRDCSEQPWPYYEATCLRDRKRLAGKVRAVRLITTDRLTAK